ncbi:MAG: hypothetical protein WD269_05780 [Acidimicrobiia bacterium]
MSRSLRHLSHRFFEVLLAKPLDSHELTRAASWVEPGLWEIFIDQQTADQRHCYRAGAKIASDPTNHQDLVVAAMMHDVGKRASRLGVLARIIATLLMAIGAPMSRRMARYRDHGALGADELERAGAPPIAVLFARHHQEDRPDSIAAGDWATLIRADEPGMPGRIR